MEYSLIYDEIVELTKAQFEQCRVQLNLDKNVVVYNERTFEGLDNDLEENTIYVIVHFELGTIMLGGTIQPIMLEVISEENSIEIAYNLLLTYGQTFNYNIPTVESGSFVQQVYTTPTIQENFAEVGKGYRAILNTNGTIIYGDDISGVSAISVSGGTIATAERILFTSVDTELQISPNSANLGNNNSRTKTLNKFATFSMTFNMVSQDTNFTTLCDNVMLGSTSINTELTFTIVKNGTTFTKVMHFIDLSYNQTQGGIPTYTVGLSE